MQTVMLQYSAAAGGSRCSPVHCPPTGDALLQLVRSVAEVPDADEPGGRPGYTAFQELCRRNLHPARPWQTLVGRMPSRLPPEIQLRGMVSTQPGDSFGMTFVPQGSQQRSANNGAVPALCFEVLRMRLDALVGLIAISMDHYRKDVEGKHYSVFGHVLGCAHCGTVEGSGKSGKLHACEGCEVVFYCSEWLLGLRGQDSGSGGATWSNLVKLTAAGWFPDASGRQRPLHSHCWQHVKTFNKHVPALRSRTGDACMQAHWPHHRPDCKPKVLRQQEAAQRRQKLRLQLRGEPVVLAECGGGVSPGRCCCLERLSSRAWCQGWLCTGHCSILCGGAAHPILYARLKGFR